MKFGLEFNRNIIKKTYIFNIINLTHSFDFFEILFSLFDLCIDS